MKHCIVVFSPTRSTRFWLNCWLAVVLVFGAFVLTNAYAQVMSFPIPACVPRAPLTTLPVPVAPNGLPDRMGGICPGLIEVNAAGAAAAFACPLAGGSPILYLYAVRWASITPAMLTDFAQLGLPGDNAERIKLLQAHYQDTNVWDMCDVWGPARERINALMPTTPTPPPISAPLSWVVAKYSLQSTRPAYRVVSGARSTTSTSRAAVGATCDCAAPIQEGITTWCPFTGSGGAVSVCVKP